MKNISLFTLSLTCFIFFATTYNLFSQISGNNELPIRVAQYKGDKKCAISYTFDDGLSEHYTVVAPQLEKYNFKGTFWINGAHVNDNTNSKKDTTRVSWTELKEMADNGHEISNHGWSHKKLTRLSLEEARFEIFKNDSAIFENTGTRPVTFCYPYNAKNEEILELASMNRVSTRIQQMGIGKNSTTEGLETWVNKLFKENEWGITMIHGINYGYDAFTDPSILWDHLGKVKSMEDSIWIGTYRDVATYLRERVHLKLEVDKIKDGSFKATPKLNLDKALFAEPLTLVLEKKGISKISVTQDKKKVPVQIYPDKVIFDFNPQGGIIHISL